MINQNNRATNRRRTGLMVWFLGLVLLFAARLPARAQGMSVTITNASLIDLQSALSQPQGIPWTIYLAFTNTITTDEPLYVNYNTILVATTTNSVVISGGGASEIFYVEPGVNFTMGNIILAGGNSLGATGSNGFVGGSGFRGGTGGNGVNGGPVTGGALYNRGITTLTNCIFLTNAATAGTGGAGGLGGAGTGIGGNGGNGGNGGYAYGGAIYNSSNAVLVVSNCTFTGNVAVGGNAGAGGGSGAGGSSFSGNGGSGGVALGGAIYNDGLATIWDSTFNDNFTQGGGSQAAGLPTSNGSGGNGPAGPIGAGGAIYNLGTNIIVNSTFFLNLATGGDGGNGAGSTNAFGGNGGNGGNGDGGSLCNAGSGSLRITNCTFAGGAAFGGTNGAAGSGAFAGKAGSPGGAAGANIANLAGTVYLKNSILAYPTNGANFFNSGTFMDGNNNLSSDTTPAFTQTNSFKSHDPELEPLGFNGGLTETMAIGPASPAVNAIYDNSAPAFDQRGYPRPLGIRPCIGAFEFGLLLYATSGQITANSQFVSGIVVHAGSLSAVTDANGEFQINLPPGTYTVAPQNSTLFTPASVSVTVPPGVANVNFTASTNAAATITNVDRTLQLTFTGFSNLNYNIQAATNITETTNNWLTLTNLRAGANGIFFFTDTSTNFYTNRFYRAVVK